MRSPEHPTYEEGRPLCVMFLLTSADIGGAETLMLSLIRRFDRSRIAPELCCLKSRGAIGALLADEIPVFDRLLSTKYDLRVLPRLARLFKRRRVDAIISVGAGDKMFWGRSAARLAGVPVVICAIHSTGEPDRIGKLNRALTLLTDMFVGVAEAHGRYLVDTERFAAEKVCVIPNGIDTDRFCPRPADPGLRGRLGLGPGPVAGTVARLGPEKNHELFLEVAARARRRVPDAQFLLIGDGPLREHLAERARRLGIAEAVRFLGWRHDVDDVLRLLDVFLLTSHIEANPVSILEALATGVPVVSTRVGSVAETVSADCGLLVEPGDAAGMTEHLVQLLGNPELARAMGLAGRDAVIRRWSLEQMVLQYEELIEGIYRNKRWPGRSARPSRATDAGKRREREEAAACE